jgi:hypothetical protein
VKKVETTPLIIDAAPATAIGGIADSAKELEPKEVKERVSE